MERRLEVERARSAQWDLQRVEGDRAHVDGRVHDCVRRRVEHEVDLPPAAVGVDDEPLPVADAGAVRGPREATGTVPAHLGPAAVRVEQHHRAVGAVTTGVDGDEPVGADPAVAVAQPRRLSGRDGGCRPVRSHVDEEVVAGGLELGERARCRHRHHHASRAGSISHEFSVVPNQVIRGSRRNQTRWRRANARVPPPRGLQRGTPGRAPPRRGGRGPPCTRWPGARCATSHAARPRAPATSSTSPRARIRSNLRSIRSRTTRTWQPDARHRDGERRHGLLPEAGTERGERHPRSSAMTSSARTMRRALPGSMRPRRPGLRLRARRTRSASPPGSATRAVRRRAARGPRPGSGGRRRRPGRTDRCRRGAARGGPAPRCRRPRRAPRPGTARRTIPPTGRRRRRGGARRSPRSASVGLAVPTSMPR